MVLVNFRVLQDSIQPTEPCVVSLIRASILDEVIQPYSGSSLLLDPELAMYIILIRM